MQDRKTAMSILASGALQDFGLEQVHYPMRPLSIRFILQHPDTAGRCWG